jgi:hypothetical protein
VNGAGHEPLAQLEDALVEVDYLLPQLLFQVDPALLEVEEEEFCDVLVDFGGWHDVTVVHDLLEGLEQLAMGVESGISTEFLMSKFTFLEIFIKNLTEFRLQSS